MKLKFFIIAFILFVSVMGGMVFYYRLDPSLLARLSFYLDLANPYVRIVKVQEGLRKEEIAEVFADKLGWGDKEKSDFVNFSPYSDASNFEGHYFPHTYMVSVDDTPTQVGATMFNEFSKQTSKIKKNKSANILNEDTVIKIASLIQREAAGKHDMNLISGIIWNRIWSGMRLQVDATLQYAKGSEEEGWWSEVNSEDKKIKSAYNTYAHSGLPPSPIANPGIAAIAAAYNPQKTDCLFYLHDKKRKIHCAKTYEEHKNNIKIYLQ